MIILLSPAKTLKEDIPALGNASMPELLNKSKKLASLLKKYKPNELGELMGISAKLSQLNYERYQTWKTPYKLEDALTAIFAFRGEVYTGLNIDSYSEDDLTYANQHLRILSGLYGILKPLDAILPYRLEMGTKLNTGSHKNLYEFWGDKLTHLINRDIKSSKYDTIINLASNEYFKAINSKKLKAQVITPTFKEEKNGNYKVVSIFAKKARGLMSTYILKNRIHHIDDIKHFTLEGYNFNESLSDNLNIVFTR